MQQEHSHEAWRWTAWIILFELRSDPWRSDPQLKWAFRKVLTASRLGKYTHNSAVTTTLLSKHHCQVHSLWEKEPACDVVCTVSQLPQAIIAHLLVPHGLLKFVHYLILMEIVCCLRCEHLPLSFHSHVQTWAGCVLWWPGRCWRWLHHISAFLWYWYVPAVCGRLPVCWHHSAHHSRW